MFHQVKQAFRSPKFLVGFIIFTSLLAAAIIYPALSMWHPLQIITRPGFAPPGRYVNIQDVIQVRPLDRRMILVDVDANRLGNVVADEDVYNMIYFLETFLGVPVGHLSVDDQATVIYYWNNYYDPTYRHAGMIMAEHLAWTRFHAQLQVALDGTIIIAYRDEEGYLQEGAGFDTQDFVHIRDIVNVYHFPLGTDNFGRDMLTQMLSAMLVSLRMGLIAGLVATSIGLTLGLVSGYLGGFVDDAILFITNIFTVIPGFILLILITYSLGPAGRGVTVVSAVIGLTAWPWTCRAVRSQVLSLRNRDHVNLSKLSGHSMPRIIVKDILPYVASYVVMALILQISTAILAEAQLSMLGLGPNTAEVATLGLMMQWATMFSAWQVGAWWAFVPVILAIALMAFSLNLMNTGLDQVFNPQLRDS
ncbi:MAG: ABC transporter permease [Defluviitaleaceae bacterium]|nr:ABC transporter permease [Defluviitaleaceae bacterium]